MDDGADLVSLLHTDYSNLIPNLIASMEETTTGVIRLRALEKDGALKIPVIAVNDAATKHFSTTAMARASLPSTALFGRPTC